MLDMVAAQHAIREPPQPTATLVHFVVLGINLASLRPQISSSAILTRTATPIEYYVMEMLIVTATAVRWQTHCQMRVLRAHASVLKITQNSLCRTHAPNVMLPAAPDSELTGMSVIPVGMATSNKAVGINVKIVVQSANGKIQLQIIEIHH